MEFKCAHSHFYIISPLNVCASIYYLLKIQPAGCYKHGTLLAVFTHRYGCCRNSLAGSGPGFQELLCFTKQGSLFIQICVCVSVQSLSRVWLFPAPRAATHQSFCSWYFPGKNPGASCHFFLQGIFPTWGLKWHLLSLLHSSGFFQCATWEALLPL